MIYTTLIHKAIQFAIKTHELDAKQRRKGTDVPYVTHPLTVGIILSRVTDDENIIAAGILHDTIEDCEPYGTTTKEMITEKFNSEIAQMVDDVTEQDKTLSWMERKLAAFEHIKHMNHGSLLVKSADVLHNLTELNDDVATNGISVFSKFNASQEDTIQRYQKLIPEIQNTWIENPICDDLRIALETLIKATLPPKNVSISLKYPDVSSPACRQAGISPQVCTSICFAKNAILSINIL